MSITTLQRRLNAIYKASARGPKKWLAVLEQGEPVPDNIRAILVPGDTLIIRAVPVGWFPDFQPSICEVRA